MIVRKLKMVHQKQELEIGCAHREHDGVHVGVHALNRALRAVLIHLNIQIQHCLTHFFRSKPRKLRFSRI